MLPLISFEAGRKTPTQSSGQAKQNCASKWKSGSTSVETTAERQPGELRNSEELVPALLPSALGELSPS
jgi:hypothetical protein